MKKNKYVCFTDLNKHKHKTNRNTKTIPTRIFEDSHKAQRLHTAIIEDSNYIQLKDMQTLFQAYLRKINKIFKTCQQNHMQSNTICKTRKQESKPLIMHSSIMGRVLSLK